MKIAIGSDHAGFELKDKIINTLTTNNIKFIDVGTHSSESVDYPDYSSKVTDLVTEKICDLGILICGTGIGMSISANKKEGIRAALVNDVFSAKATKNHNNSNVLCLGARVIGEDLAMLIIDTWLNSEFEGGRHQARIDKLESC
ncbi:ribose 5-phosphate isomerase B [Aerococcaceae bacterium WGS1372]